MTLNLANKDARDDSDAEEKAHILSHCIIETTVLL